MKPRRSWLYSFLLLLGLMSFAGVTNAQMSRIQECRIGILAGDLFGILLSGTSPSTGYRWRLTGLPDCGIRLIDQFTYHPIKGFPPVGGPAMEGFVFKSTFSCQTALLFRLIGPAGQRAETAYCQINVR
jgi:hypothetical protein